MKRWRLVGLSVLIVAAGVGAVDPSAAEGPGAPDAAGRLDEDTAGAALDAMREHAVPAPRDGTPAPAALTELVRRTETMSTALDPVGDATWVRGDLTGGGASASASRTTALLVTVAYWESPFSASWQYGNTGVIWSIDTDGNGTTDYTAGLVNVNGSLGGVVLDRNDQAVCSVFPGWSSTDGYYGVAFDTACLGNPASFTWYASMLYQDFATGISSLDEVPDFTWAAPVFNDAYVPPATTPTTTSPSAPPTTQVGSGGPVPTPAMFNAVEPNRVFDTRPGTGGLRQIAKTKVGGSYVLQVQMTDLAGLVPATGVAAVSLNVAVTNPEADGYITVYPCNDRAVVASLNYTKGQTVPNAVIAPVSASGMVCFFSMVNTDLIADVNGWFATGKGFTAVLPDRLFDTRPGSGGRISVPPVKVGGGYVLQVPVTGVSGVPTSGVAAVSLNVAVTSPDAAGFVTVYPCDARKEVANLNYVANQTVPNAVIAPVSANGTVCFYSLAPTHIVTDINGWFAAGAGFTAVSPDRVFDTRPGTGGLRGVTKAKVGGEYVLEVKVTDLPGLVPATGVSAVSLNVAVTQPDGPGFVTLYPCGTRREVASLNYEAGQTVPNAVIAPVSANGTVCFYSLVPTHIVADINGWFATA